jgi:benzylsuccinate CoA-transferase BbsF subunit
MNDKLPLDGIRVADFTQVVQGPYATTLLGQMGAEIIKIETLSRTQMDQRYGPMFSNLNGSKKSITLNLKDSRGADIAKKLVKISDVAMENFGTGVMERFGLGYDDLREIKPDIVMLSSQALGRTGPMKDAIGYFAEASNFAGFSHLTGYSDGRPGMVGAIWADHLTGMHMIFAVLAALRHQRKTGEGQYIQMSMAEMVISAIPEAVLDYSVNGRDLGRQENKEIGMAPHNVYRCEGFDKWIAISVGNEEEWNQFCGATGHREWANDPRFSDPLSRWDNQKELDKLITEWSLNHSDYEAMAILQKAGIASGPVLYGNGLVNDPHLIERGSFVPLGEVEGNPYSQVAHPWRLSDSPTPYYALAPGMGEHNKHVLSDLLGMNESDISTLENEGVLV